MVDDAMFDDAILKSFPVQPASWTGWNSNGMGIIMGRGSDSWALAGSVSDECHYCGSVLMTWDCSHGAGSGTVTVTLRRA